MRLKNRRVSYPFANVVDHEGRVKVVFADEFSDGRRPENTAEYKSADFICPSCKGTMHWVVGHKMPNQPDSLLSEPTRGRAYFAHNPGQLNDHIVTQETSIAADLVEYLYKNGLDNAYNPQMSPATSDRAWVVSYHFTRDDGSVFELPLIVSPTSSQILMDHPNAVVITATDGKAGDRQRLILYDDKYNPLSSQQVHDYLTAHGISKFYVSGFFERVAMKREKNGSPVFRPKQIPLREAITNILDGSYVFVEGVDGIKFENFPTGAKYGLVRADQKPVVERLINISHPRIHRRAVAETLAYENGLTIQRDSSRVGNTGKFRFGEADILYVHHGMADNPGAGPVHGQRKVIVNPSPNVLLRKMSDADWSNSMVLFIGQQRWWSDFKSSDAINYLAGVTREQRKEMGEGKFFTKLQEEHGVVIRNVNNFNRAQTLVVDYLGEEIQQAKDRVAAEQAELFPEPPHVEQTPEPQEDRSDPHFNLKIFLDHETGMDELPQEASAPADPNAPKDLGIPYQRHLGMSPIPFGRDIYDK